MTTDWNRYLLLAAALGLLCAGPVLAKNGNGPTEAQINAALVAMAAGPLTLAGPGHVVIEGGGGNRTIFSVISGAPADVCVTVRNRGPKGRLRIVVPGTPDQDGIPVGLTVSGCFASAGEIQLRCGGDGARSCQAVWRVDRF